MRSRSEIAAKFPCGRGPDAMEPDFVGLTVSLASAMVCWSGAQVVRVSQSLEAVSLASCPQTHALRYHA